MFTGRLQDHRCVYTDQTLPVPPAGLTALHKLVLLRADNGIGYVDSQTLPSNTPLSDLTQLTCLQLHVRRHQSSACMHVGEAGGRAICCKHRTYMPALM